VTAFLMLLWILLVAVGFVGVLAWQVILFF
jgi:hypothetical protein